STSALRKRHPGLRSISRRLETGGTKSQADRGSPELVGGGVSGGGLARSNARPPARSTERARRAPAPTSPPAAPDRDFRKPRLFKDAPDHPHDSAGRGRCPPPTRRPDTAVRSGSAAAADPV